MLGHFLMIAAGVFLVAFFAGTETGFYRVPRVRLVIEAVGGSSIARGLLWLGTRPTLFVATTLVGASLGNYLVSLAIVMGAQHFYPGSGALVEVAATIVLSPFLFVYGELLPKNLFLRSPGKLLRYTAPLIFFFTGLFMPVTAVLWAAGKLLEWLLGVSPQIVRRRLVRAELKRVFEEGHEAGILRPAQRALAHGLFAVAKLTVRDAMVPAIRLVAVREDLARDAVLRLARRHQMPEVPVESVERRRQAIGYVTVADLALENTNRLGPIRPLLAFGESEPYLTALTQLQAAGERIARVIDDRRNTVGYVTLQQMVELLFRGGT